MDRQDLQDDRRSDLQFGEITERIIGCAFEVINELGVGFLESVYEKAFAIALQDNWNRGWPTDQFWQSETRIQTIHTTQVNRSATQIILHILSINVHLFRSKTKAYVLNEDLFALSSPVGNRHESFAHGGRLQARQHGDRTT